MSVTSKYRDSWEGFWREAPDETGAVLWDADPALTVAPHLTRFAARIDRPELPLVDLGCGNGTQTRYLAAHYADVIGVDLSHTAVERARSQDTDGTARFEQLDATDTRAVHDLHARLGDANVYVRGVLHQCDPADRQPVADAVATLLGARGRAFVVELAEGAKRVLTDLARHPQGPPPKLRPVFAHGIAPGEVSDTGLVELLSNAGLDVLAEGALPVVTTEHTAEGLRIEVPSRWFVLASADARAPERSLPS
ncbi:class I SAM-dependent methyltransferase [Streptomyces xanthochromogenes]|uniref:class I SAM-dependent methyltransferase n=1 Tax=Streptomyces xanthochromogenes TaxID=67384 RepID=UPI003425F507